MPSAGYLKGSPRRMELSKRAMQSMHVPARATLAPQLSTCCARSPHAHAHGAGEQAGHRDGGPMGIPRCRRGNLKRRRQFEREKKKAHLGQFTTTFGAFACWWLVLLLVLLRQGAGGRGGKDARQRSLKSVHAYDGQSHSTTFCFSLSLCTLRTLSCSAQERARGRVEKQRTSMFVHHINTMNTYLLFLPYPSSTKGAKFYCLSEVSRRGRNRPPAFEYIFILPSRRPKGREGVCTR